MDSLPKAGQSEPLLLLYVRSDNLSGDFWFSPISDPALKKYEDVMHIDDIHDYYIKFASDYEQVMLGWGYCMPEITAEVGKILLVVRLMISRNHSYHKPFKPLRSCFLEGNCQELRPFGR